MADDSGKFSEISKPRAIGRIARGVAGAALVLFVIQVARKVPAFLAAERGRSIPRGDWWIAALVCFLALPRVVNDGFARTWGRWPQMIYLGLVGLALIWDLRMNGAFWAAPLAFLVLAMILFVLGQAALSFIVAAVAATPG